MMYIYIYMGQEQKNKMGSFSVVRLMNNFHFFCFFKKIIFKGFVKWIQGWRKKTWKKMIGE